MQRYQEYINVVFAGFNGDELKKVRIERGKGPGEVLFPLNIEVDDDNIVICDSGMRRTTLFDMDGQYDDSFEMDTDTGMIFLSSIKDKKMAFNSFNETLIGVMDIQNGKVIHSIPHEKTGFPGNDDPYLGCAVTFDTDSGDIYTGWADSPYRIEIYSPELELKKTIYKKIDFDMDDPTWYSQNGGLDMQGDFLIASISVDENYIYTPSHEMSVIFEGGIEVNELKGSVCVFDKKTGNFVRELTF